MAEQAAGQEAVLQYKGHPLMRKENVIYYGSMSDKYIIMMQVRDSKPMKDIEIATRVEVQLRQTSPNVSNREKIVKKTEKDSLWAAMDVASIWLGRALNGK